MLFQITIAWILATLVYQIGSRIENGAITLTDAIITSVIVITVTVIFLKRKGDGEECGKCPYSKSCCK